MMRLLPLVIRPAVRFSVILACAVSGAQAQSLTVNGNTVLPADTAATYSSITVQNGGMLEIGGGSTITVTGALTINAGGTVLCRSKDIDAQVDGVWAGVGVTIHAGSVSIAATGVLSADGQGYVNGIGPGFPTGLAASTAYRTGASHGGAGTGTGAVGTYGSGYEPTTPGTGAAFQNDEQTAGGGAIRLIVDGTLTLNGEISADGTGTPAPASNVYHGGATGGSIWVTADTLTGSGILTADARKSAYSNTASTPYGESGGGRIAIYARTAAGFTGLAASAVNPGGGTAQEGTLVFAVGAPGAQVMRIKGRPDFPQDLQLTLASLMLDPDATLSLGGGTALSISGALTLGDGANLIFRSKNLTQQIGDVWSGTGATLQANTVTVPATAKISADGEGYFNGIGPGVSATLEPTSLQARRSGASHGGAGTGGSTNVPVGGVYGSSLQPSTPGQGAGGGTSDFVAGGGAIRLIVDDTLTLDGAITANGISIGSARGGATGGSIWVKAGILAGTGRFTADAVAGTGTGLGHSGGGRIAVYFGNDASFGGFLTSTVNASNVAGQIGTLVFVNTSVPGGGAMRVSQRMTLDEGPVFSLGSLSVDNGATLTVAGGVALDIDGTLTVTGNSTLQLGSAEVVAQVDGAWVGTGARIEVGHVLVEAGSRISADGEGYRNGVGPGMSSTLVPTSLEARRAGASHGGAGTGGSTDAPVVGVYGSSLQPLTPGQGAGGGTTDFVAGGGALRLIVAGTLTLNGTVTANGISVGSARGGATGGSLWVTTGTLAGSGRFAADAVAGTGTALGHSGGGRIAVYYEEDASFTGFLTSTVNASNAGGQTGTLVFIDTSGGSRSLRVPQRMTLDEGPIFSIRALTVENGATLEVAGGVALDVATLAVTGNSTLLMRSRDQTAMVNGVWAGSGALIVADTIVVAAGSRISADGEGYRNGDGPGFPSTLIPATAYRTGASYGGRATGEGALPPFGSLLEPVILGTGAAAGDGSMTAGGGAIRIIVENTLTLDGEITANGVADPPASGTAHGGATGGSIWVTTGALTGAGRFTADAYPAVFFNGFTSHNGHSSAGRIAVYYQSATGFSGFTSSSATNPHGTSSAGVADLGTVIFGQLSGDQIDARCFTRLDVLDGNSLELRSLTLEAGAVLDLYGGSTLRIDGLLDLREDSVVNFLSRNRDASFNGAWIGEGARIDAGDMRVSASAVITADSQGYKEAGGPGGPNALQTQTTGGSYGGRGSGASAKEPYGSLVAPRDLGSAGGYGRNGAHPYTTNVAGGAVFLNVSGSLQFDGKISAIGSSGGTLHGGATGGSVLIRAKTLTGGGLIDASAVPGSSSKSSGGRVAIWAESNTMPASLISVAPSGSGAEPGTIYLADANEIAWIVSVNALYSGPVRLEWITIGGTALTGVDLLAQPESGPALTLATGLAVDGDFVWDTTTVEDGTYTLTVRKRDTRSGEILGSDTRTVTVVNDNLVLRGTLTGDVTIPSGKVTYVIGEVTIPGGVKVTVEPGAIIKVSLGGSFLAEEGGSFVALGTPEAPIVITSILDDTVGGDNNFDGAASLPGEADWLGLRSIGGTYALNENTEIRHTVKIVGGEIRTTVRWRAGSIHLVQTQLDILPGGSLTIEAGAIVKVARGAFFRVVGGTLITEGTQLRPVVFTSDRDDSFGGDSNGDGSLTTPIAGDWYGLFFDNTVSSLRHTRFHFGGESAARFRGMFDVRAADVTFDSCTFVDTLFDVVHLQPDMGGTVTLNNCLFVRADRGVLAFRGSSAVVRNCVFDNISTALHYRGGRIDVTNSAITNSLEWGVFVESGSAITDFAANAFWNPRATGGNSSDAAVVIGENGVIAGDPKFVDRFSGDFRVLAGSPLVDAGEASSSAASDFRGFARLGSAPEIGAFEFTEPHTSTVDLQAEILASPTAAMSGTPVELTLVARNAGTASVTGPWRHTIFLRPATGGADIPVGEFVDHPEGTLAADATATFTVSLTVPEGLVGLYHWGVTVNLREDLFEGTNLSNNTSLSAGPAVFDVPELPFGGSVTGRFFRAGESRVYKVRAADPGQTIHLLGDTEATRGFTQLLAARGRVPTFDDFDAQSPQWDLPDATLSIPGSADDWYYVRILASELRVATTAFTLAARSVEFQLTGVGLDLVGTGPVTIPVLGTDLRNGAMVSLRPIDGATPISSRGVTVTGGTAADASFDLTGAAPGLYDVVVTQGGIERVIQGGVRVSSAAAGAKVITTVAGPGVNRVGFPYFAAITARNTGAADAPAPIITVTGPGLPVDLSDPDNPFYGYGFGETDARGRDFFLAIPPTGNPAVLPAGRTAETFIAQGITPDGGFSITTNIVQVGDTTPYDLAGLGVYLAPDPKPTGWDDAWTMIASGEPQTLGGLARLIGNAAEMLYRTRGFRSNSVTEILSLYVADFHMATLSQVRGRVLWLDAAVQLPLGGIDVSLVRADSTVAATATTLPDGSFSFPTVVPGIFDWEIAGAYPADSFPPLSIDLGTTVNDITLPLLPGGSAHARVLPVAGVEFAEMQVSLTNPSIPLTVSVAPDALGNATLRGLADGSYILTVMVPGRPPVMRSAVEIGLAQPNDLGTFQFSSSVGIVKGRIVRADTLAPIDGAVVSVSGSDGPTGRSDADGNFEIAAVPAGTRDIRVRAAGFAPGGAVALSVPDSGVVTANIELTLGSEVAGVVTEAGAPLAGVPVDVLNGTTVVASALTDAVGQYRHVDLPAGAFTIESTSPRHGAANAPVVLSAGSETVANLSLLPLPAVEGAVRYQGGVLAGPVGIRVTKTPDGDEYAVTNSDGRFQLKALTAGDYVWSLADGGERRPFTVDANGLTGASLNVVVAAGEITGRILAADNTSPVLTVVHLVSNDRIVSATGSDSDGNYRFSLVAPGSYSVYPAGFQQFYGSAINVEVVAGAAVTVPDLVAGDSTLDVTLRLEGTDAVPSAPAMAFLERAGEPAGVNGQMLVQADAHGIVHFGALAPGTYLLHAVGIGTTTEKVPVVVASGNNQSALALTPAAYIQGRVTSSGTVPVEEVEVVAYRSADPTVTWRGPTDEDGNYTIGGLPAGTYMLQLTDHRTGASALPFVMPAASPISLAPDETDARDFSLAASGSTVSGTVAAADGSYPYSADISLISEAGVEVVRRKVDPAGLFSLPAPAPGDYSLRLSAIAFTAPSQAVTVGVSSLTANVDAQWVGGATRLSATGSSPLGRDGTPLLAYFFSESFSWVDSCVDSFRELLEELLQKPPPPAPEIKPPAILKDPCYSCPGAQEAWRRAARLQMIANNQYSAWHDAWEAQVEQVSAEVGLMGVAVLKLAGALYTAQLDALEVELTLAAELPKMGQIVVAMTKPPRDANIDWAIAHHDQMWKILDAFKGLMFVNAGTSTYTQLESTGANKPKIATLKETLSKSSTYRTWDGLYGLGSDLVGVVKTANDLLSVSSAFRESLRTSPTGKRFSKVLGALDKLFTMLDPIVQGSKTVKTVIDTASAAKASGDLYKRVIEKRDQAYQECILAIPDCECVGGEECECEPPPPKPPGPKPPKPPGGPNGGKGNGRGDAAHDPNAKYTIGYGDEGYVRPDEPLIYTITFENIAEAGLPAQRVIITDQLSDNLDWSTFELLAAGFNRTSFAIPPGLQRYTTRTSVDTDPNPVRSDLRLNPATGLFTIDLRSVDAVTGGYPRDSLAGFLPPNDDQHRGEGFVTFMIKPKSSQPDGTQIRNLASIVFDTNEAIVTNEALNTIDSRPPSARVTELPPRSSDTFEVSWSPTNAGGSTVLGYSVWVSRNGGPWELWMDETAATSALFTGTRGSSYQFFAVARDAVGWSDAATFSSQSATGISEVSFLVNISNRGGVGTGPNIMIPGFVIDGTGTKKVLVRAVGPTLGGFGVQGTLEDPQLTVVSGGADIAVNDNWSAAPEATEIAAVAARVGAFPLEADSADAAALLDLEAGSYTVKVSGVALGTGVALVELYDTDEAVNPTSKLVNISNRGEVGVGSAIMIPGFVVGGETPKTVLIRGVGPKLGDFGVQGVLEDPTLGVFRSGEADALHTNDNWGDAANATELAAATASVGAFALEAGSRDAAVLVTLEPGAYTVKVSGVDGTEGVALVEIYEVED